MGNSLKDAFDRARRKLVGEALREEEKAPSFVEQLRQIRTVPVAETADRDGAVTPNDRRRQREEAMRNVKVTYGHVPQRPRRERQDLSRQAPPVVQTRSPSIAKQPRVTPPQPTAKPIPTPPPSHTVSVSKLARFALAYRDEKPAPLLSKVESAGRATQCHAGKTDDDREVVLGLDFGTSTVKVVIGDAALGKAFAVPFCHAEGIGGFLLSSRLCQTGRAFSLEAGTYVHRDLKLALLASPEAPVLQQRVVAFLALVIRRARGWLFSEHAAAYKRTGIVWKLAVGLPAAQHLESTLSRLFERLSLAAWVVACSPGDVSETLTATVIGDGGRNSPTADDVEVTIVPEIAAQIYGFVASNSFDKSAANIYLMADVGAGTIDSSLFHVKPGKGGRWDFEFFTSVVEPNGVSNLHRQRVNWWGEELTKLQAPQHLLDDLAACKLVTDQQLSTPESYLEYFDGMTVKFEDSVKTPDESFFNLRVLAQVRGKTFWRTWKDNLLPKEHLTNIPFFMCGGGVRMEYYQALEPALASMPSYSWLNAECWVMGVPDDLVADGLAEADYDRLSVAYGLSRLEVGKIVKALPQPKLDIPPVNSWRDNYTDKDQC